MVATPSELTAALTGLRVSRPWKGYGSAVFLDLGELREVQDHRRRLVEGESCISIEWDWRLELGSSIVGGSSDSGPAIQSYLKLLRDSTIESVEVQGVVPELVVRFSTRHVLRSMAMCRGDPQWHIKTPMGCLYAQEGILLIGDHVEQVTEQERVAFELAESAALRWGGAPASAPPGLCQNCSYYVGLDGTGHLLDYGCCVSNQSPFDGRAVYFRSGCTAYASAHPL